MNTWKYTDATQHIVVSEDGCRSGLATALVQEGDTVLPPDPVVPEVPFIDPRDTKIAELTTRLLAVEDKIKKAKL